MRHILIVGMIGLLLLMAFLTYVWPQDGMWTFVGAETYSVIWLAIYIVAGLLAPSHRDKP